ncbi:BTB/POZ domain-containing protein 2-like [Nilaparvata lugens]|uniref:BTB/POZ domain-containing protein 2-like n=1 Tax=Nilaparvata lugens TaxID=108931 RepID=UPI00193E04CE|nr:BTB/POZ domain-containing protein 2-like [Nilaparvata lugens]
MSYVPSILKSKIELCLNNDDLSDCEFVVGKQNCFIKGHKLLFAINSPVFRDLLYNNGHTSNNATAMEIEDVEANEFNGMKQFFYTESVDFTSSLHACSVYLAAWKYVVPDLMSTCVQYIKCNISVTEVIDVYQFSIKHNIPDIETICFAFFQNKTTEIMQSEKFLSADINTVETILKMDSLNLNSELELFNYTEKWVHAEASRRKVDLPNQSEHFNCIIRHIRFLTMSKEQYREGPSQSDLLAAEEKLSIIHKLLGFEDQLSTKLSPLTENRIFTEVKPEDRKEVRLSLDKIFSIPSKAEKFEFIFTAKNKKFNFKYQGLDLEIYYEFIQKSNIDNFTQNLFVIKLINNHKIKLHSVEKMEVVRYNKSKFIHTIVTNVSTIVEDEYTFPYLPLSGYAGTGLIEIQFELNLLKLEESDNLKKYLDFY